jgi:peroxiredoxin
MTMAIQEGKSAPAFTLPDQNGNKVAKAADHPQKVLEAVQANQTVMSLVTLRCVEGKRVLFLYPRNSERESHHTTWIKRRFDPFYKKYEERKATNREPRTVNPEPE